MGDILTTDVFRLHVSTSLGDEAIEHWIAKEEALMTRRLGELGSDVTDVRWPRGQRTFLLGRRPAAIQSITWLRWDQETVLTEEDYVLDTSTLRLLDTGPNPFDPYIDRLTIVYTPEDDEAIRLGALIRLVALDIQQVDSGAVQARTVGKHSVTFGDPASRAAAREDVWAELDNGYVPILA